MAARGPITLGILAGGQGRRMGGVDKALLEFDGASLLARTLAAMPGDFAQTLVSYNGAAAAIAPLGARAVADLRGGFPGPLGGLEALLRATESAWLLTVPVDLRQIPSGLAAALCGHAAEGLPGQGAVLRDADGLQPLVALWPVATALDAVRQALDSGQFAVHPVIGSLQLRVLDISPRRLGNLNTPSDFE
jgi:molybdopterin-guanine dinucleotide biosynthesis protein A